MNRERPEPDDLNDASEEDNLDVEVASTDDGLAVAGSSGEPSSFGLVTAAGGDGGLDEDSLEPHNEPVEDPAPDVIDPVTGESRDGNEHNGGTH